MLTTPPQAWRFLTRSYLDESRSKELLAYTPMLHARLFQEQAKFRDAHFQPTKESLASQEESRLQPYLDGNPQIDRPLIVQFCANKPEEFLEAAQYVAPYCDAVDLNLGCPQGIAKSGHYGAFLQEDWDTIHKLIRKLRDELEIPVTAKFRIQETKEKTLEYARMILEAGASILTVHGRQRHQKGHNTGLADWQMIRYLRESLPPETVLFANGNILNSTDIEPCLEATGADGVMSAEGNLSDPTIFAEPPHDKYSRDYWRDVRDPTIGGYRIDGVFRRYMDIIHRYVLEQEPPHRAPLYTPGDRSEVGTNGTNGDRVNGAESSNGLLEVATGSKRSNDMVETDGNTQAQKPSKKQKTKRDKKDMTAVHNPNLKSMQGHLFQLLRPMLSSHTNIRDALARSRAGDIAAFENVLCMVEEAVKQGLDDEHAEMQAIMPTVNQVANDVANTGSDQHPQQIVNDQSSDAARERCKRPFWVCQPHIRPLPDEAVKLGAMQLSKKEKEALARKEIAGKPKEVKEFKTQKVQEMITDVFRSVGGIADGEAGGGVQGELGFSKSQAHVAETVSTNQNGKLDPSQVVDNELPKEEALTCG